MANPELEVINALCANKDISVLLTQGSDDLFVAYGDVWQGIKQYYDKYRAVPDISTLREKYKKLDEVTTSGETEYYLDKLKENYVKSRIDQIMERAAANINKMPAPEILENLNTALSKLTKFTSNVRDLNITDLESAEDYYKELRDKVELAGHVGIQTGFKSIDSAYHTGMAPGHLIYAIGYSGRAKSWFSELLAINVWEQGYKPMIVSLEMTPELMRDRIYTMMGSGLFRQSSFARGEVNIDDLTNWGRKRLVDKSNFIITSTDSSMAMTPNVVQGKISQYKPDFVVLDYAQLMMDNAHTDGMTSRMMNLSNECKRLATANNIPILVISAVTDEESSDRSQPPLMKQIAWSRAMEYNADMAFAVHRHDDSDLVEVVGRKNRHGDLFDFFFEVDIDRGIWNEKHDI